MFRKAISGRKMNIAFDAVPIARWTRLPPSSCSTASQTCLIRGLNVALFDQVTKSSQLVMDFSACFEALAGGLAGLKASPNVSIATFVWTNEASKKKMMLKIRYSRNGGR